MNSYLLEPLDTLFFRDARPMASGAGSGGHGANWPLPTLVHEALRSALLRHAGELPKGRIHKRKVQKTNGIREKTFASEVFASLQTRGPFPCRNGALYLPCPNDLVLDEFEKPVMLQVGRMPDGAASNMPGPGLRHVMPASRCSKHRPPEWITCEAFKQSLAGQAPSLPKEEKLFFTENRIGIEIDPLIRSAKEHHLFTSEHMRLAPGVSLWFEACLSSRDEATLNTGVGLENCVRDMITIGGESRRCRVENAAGNGLSSIPRPSGRHIKWALVSHAVFLGGWRPDWIDESTGEVKLRKTDNMERMPEESRLEWRERLRQAPFIGAKLVAACVSKPIHFSGWDLTLESTDKEGRQKLGGPKPTMLAVPAGSVYYFEADSDEDAKALVAALHGRTRSDCMGEKGMGYGFCGTWEEMTDVG